MAGHPSPMTHAKVGFNISELTQPTGEGYPPKLAVNSAAGSLLRAKKAVRVVIFVAVIVVLLACCQR
jgi:hypothetical protein